MVDPSSDAVILARVSSKGQEDEGYSLDSQVKLLQSYCDNKCLIVKETFKIAESASKSVQRTIFKSAMKFIEDNNIKNLVIEKVDRHVRNLHDAVETHDWLTADENKKVHFVKDSLVLHKDSRSQEWLNWGIRVVMAKNYIDNLREEAMKGWAEKLAQGWLPAPPPPGYVTVIQNGKKVHEPDPARKALMHQVFTSFLEPGQSSVTTTKLMDVMGFRTAKGHPYNKSKVHDLLINPFYIGINHFNGKDYPGAQEPIISRELFEAVQAKMHGKRTKKFTKHYSVLKGLIKCEDCGTTVTWQLQKGRYYGVCRRSSEACRRGKLLREDLVEAKIVEQLERLVCPAPEIIHWVATAMRNQFSDTIENRERLVASITAQMERVSRMDDTLYDDKLSGEITKGKYEEKHEQFVVQRKELTERLTKINKSHGKQLEQKLVLLELAQKAAQIYLKKTPEQKRLILSKLFANLTLKDSLLSVSYTNFTRAIAEKVELTCNLMEATK